MKKAYLTFDDGPSEPWTKQVLDILEKEGIKATFFVCGKNVERHPEILKLVHEAGHSIGNHTYSHDKLRTLLGVGFELSRTNKVVKSVIGISPRLYRAPYGYFTPWILPYTFINRMKLVGWNTLGLDWKEITPQKISENVSKVDKDRLIILLHDGHDVEEVVDRSRTVEALKIIIPELRRRGYSFFPL